MAHGHQIKIHRVKHQFGGEQHHNEVAAGKKAAHTDAEQRTGKAYIPVQRNHDGFSIC